MKKFSLLVLLSMSGLAQAECYRADADSSEIKFEFAVERSVFSGQFMNFDLSYCWQQRPEDGQITVSIDMTSVRTGNSDLDIGMQEKEGLATALFQQANWQTQTITKEGERFRAKGLLTIRGVSHEESGFFTLKPAGEGWHLRGSSALKRLDYAIGTGEFADTEFIPNPVKVEFDFTLKAADQTLEQE